MALSDDGKTLYASSSSNVYSWPYDAAAATVDSGKRRTLVQNMSNTDHTTRTLLRSHAAPGQLLVSRGSSENLDADARDLASGHSQIRAFDLSGGGQPYDYASGGRLVGWGLRNSVGLAEEPRTGGLFSVENSADQLQRGGRDVHQDDPGEELNFHGVLNATASSPDHSNFGYPDCFALWGTDVPDLGSMNVGSQFALDPTGKPDDAGCAQNYVAPRLTFQVCHARHYEKVE